MNTSNVSKQKPSDPSKAKTPAKALISTGAMTIMIITTVVSLRGLPSQAEFGIQSIFYYLFAALFFLVPFSLVCAELASTYTHSGGLYRWVSEAFGPRWGWSAMYLEWQTLEIIENAEHPRRPVRHHSACGRSDYSGRGLSLHGQTDNADPRVFLPRLFKNRHDCARGVHIPFLWRHGTERRF